MNWKNTLAFLFLAMVVAGCANAPAPTQRPVAFEPGKGFVAIRIVTNTSSLDTGLGLFFNRWSTLTLVGQDGASVHLTTDFNGGRSTSSVFAGMVREGRYSLKTLAAPSVGTTIAVPLDNVSGQFQVKSGHVTLLGTLVYQPTGGQKFTVLRFRGESGLSDLLGSEYPALAQQTAGQQTLGWDVSNEAGSVASVGSSVPAEMGLTVGLMQMLSDKLNETEVIKAWQEVTDPATRLSMAKESSYSFSGALQLADGTILAGSHLGQVLIRESSGKWLRSDTGDAREIVAVHASSRKDILVGGEEGLLLSTEDGGATWKRIASPANTGLILRIFRHDSKWYLVSRWNEDIVVTRSADSSPTAWQEIRRTTAPAQPTPRRTWLYGAAMDAERLYVISPPKALHILDMASGNWTEKELPVGALNIGAVDEKFLYFTPAYGKAYRSMDHGESWQVFSADCTKHVAMEFASAQNAYALCLSIGMFSVSTRLSATKDGGKTWQTLIPETPLGAQALLAGRNTDLVLYVDISGRLYLSNDGGKTWKEERRTFQ